MATPASISEPIPNATMNLSDNVLSRLRVLARDVQNGTMVTDAEAEFLLAAIGPALDELAQHRATIDAVRKITAPGVVLQFDRGAQ
jgi:hypothetical protein